MQHLSWNEWLLRLFITNGTALLLSGVVYFFAFNWDAMSKWVKLGIIEAGIAVCLLGVWRWGYASSAGQMLAFCISVLVGVFLAVFGQIYQTGANTWQLFATWASCILPWTLIARNPGQWVLLLVLLNVTLWLRHPLHYLWEFPAIVLNGLFFMVAERCRIRKITWLQARWIATIPLLPVLLVSTKVLSYWLYSFLHGRHDQKISLTLLISVAAIGGSAILFVRLKDSARLALVLLCGYPVLVSTFAGWVDTFHGLDFGHFGAIGVLLFAYSVAGAKWLKHVQASSAAVYADTDDADVRQEQPEPVSADDPAQSAPLSHNKAEGSTPAMSVSLPMAALLCAGAFLAALFFTVMIEILADEFSTIHIRGLIMLMCSGLVFVLTGSNRGSHLISLSLSFALLLIGITQFMISGMDTMFWIRFPILSIALIILYVVLKHALLRFASAAAWVSILMTRAVLSTQSWSFGLYEQTLPGPFSWNVIILALMLAGMLPLVLEAMRKPIPLFARPGGYALTGAVLVGVTFYLCRRYSVDAFAGFYTIFPAHLLTWLCAALLALLFWTEWKASHTGQGSALSARFAGILLLVASGAALLAWLGALGILLCLNLVLVGKSAGRKPYTFAGFLFLPWFLFSYYYALSATLLAKSVILGGSGLIVLLAALFIRRFFSSHACEAA